MHSEKHIYQTQIRETHLDFMGHVNNATYISLLEEARWELIHEYGIGLTEILKEGQGPVILNINIDYLKEIKNREVINIETLFSAFENKVGTVNQKIYNASGQLACKAGIQFGIIDFQSRKLIVPSDSWKKLFNLSK